MESSQDRNLPASERKLQKARKDGQVARSRELSHLAVLGTGSLALLTLIPLVVEQLELALGQQLSFNAGSIAHPQDMLVRLQEMAALGLMVSVGFAVLITIAAVLSALALGGWVTSLKPVTPDFSRLSPLSGFKALFSKKKMAEIGKILLITTVLTAISVSFLSSNLNSVAMLVLQPSPDALRQLGVWLVDGLGLLLLVILLVAVIDIPLQSFLHKSELKMSRQEMKDEHKESDGNPQLKSKMRSKQRELAQRNSIKAIPKADFVVMNPTHYAVAIQYDELSMSAPRVVSKGSDLLAMKIRDIAKAHNIPVLQSPPLARALYAHTELDQPIPAALYTAVAQILAYVYRLKAALRGDAPMPGELPAPVIPAELDPLSKTAAAVNPS